MYMQMYAHKQNVMTYTYTNIMHRNYMYNMFRYVT